MTQIVISIINCFLKGFFSEKSLFCKNITHIRFFSCFPEWTSKFVNINQFVPNVC